MHKEAEMAVRDLIKKVRTALPADALELVADTLAAMDREAVTMESALKGANSSDAERRIALRDKDKEIQRLNDQIAELDGLKSQITELEGFKKKYDEVVETQNAQVIGKWKDVSSVFDVKETDPNFEKYNRVKSDFVLTDDITPEQAKQNLKTYEIYQKAGFFGSHETPPGDDNPPKGKRIQSSNDPLVKGFGGK
jgi:glycerol-3-phosphate cytidylyltransferase-like family protein